MRIRNLLINISISVLSVVILFGSLEIWARYKVYGIHLRETGFYHRGRGFSPKGQNPAVRILCVGGSTTNGSWQVADNETYPFYLEKILNEKTGEGSAEVVNAGVPGLTAEGVRDLVKKRLKDVDIDVLVVHSVYNQLANYSYHPTIDKIVVEKNKVKPVYRWEAMNILEIMNIFLIEHSYFYVRLREKLCVMKGSDMNAAYRDLGKSKQKEKEAFYERIRESLDAERVFGIYYSALEDIILTARSQGVDVVLVFPPYPFSISLFKKQHGWSLAEASDNTYIMLFENARKIHYALGQKYGLLVVDTEKEFGRGERIEDLFTDDVHLTPRGNYLLAGIIASDMIPYLDKKKRGSGGNPGSLP